MGKEEQLFTGLVLRYKWSVAPMTSQGVMWCSAGCGAICGIVLLVRVPLQVAPPLRVSHWLWELVLSILGCTDWQGAIYV